MHLIVIKHTYMYIYVHAHTIYIYIHTHICVMTIKEKGAWILKKNKRGYMRGFEGKEREEK